MTKPRSGAARAQAARARARADRCQVPLDRSVPALVLKIGQYPVHSGGVGVLRSLGRCGVPMYAVTEPGLPPAAVSRYCDTRFVSRATGREQPADLIPGLLEAGQRIGRRAVVVPLDDESAVLTAHYREQLSEHFLLPDVAPGLPARLASKTGLFELCREHHVPTPATATPASLEDLASFAAGVRFPVVVKNADPWQRRRHPVVPGTTVVNSAAALIELAAQAGDPLNLVVQEYLPGDQAQDWISHLYCDAQSQSLMVLTARKVRSWPPHAGLTAAAYAVYNPEIAALAERFCKEIGYSGIGDLDWRHDLRDGQYKLVDFNPRPGNQFRLFENMAGVDVVRALHLDLTGREVPLAGEREGKRIVVEHIDLPARLAYWRHDRRVRASGQVDRERTDMPGYAGAATEFAWLAADDPLPFLVMIPHALRMAARAVAARIGGRLADRRQQNQERGRSCR
ncbi:MAG: hypothetical protein ACR2FU_12240 [Streptosporangiaceae bacterium]